MIIELNRRLIVETTDSYELRITQREYIDGKPSDAIQILGSDVPRLIAALTACLVDLQLKDAH